MAEDYSKPYFGNPNITKQAIDYRNRQGGYLSSEQQKGLFNTLLDFTPVVGDIKSGAEAVQSARQGDYLGAALAGIGVLPFIPSLAKSFKNTDIKFLTQKQIEKYDFSHGTTPEKAASILQSNKFDPSAGKKTYSYSQLGHDSLYLAPKDSWWLDPVKAAKGAAVSYPTVLKTDILPTAKIANIDSPKDLDNLAKNIGLKDGDQLAKNLSTEDYGAATMPDYLPTLKKLQEAGIDGLYFSKKFDTDEVFMRNLPSSEQLAIFNKSVVKPKKINEDTISPMYADPFGSSL